MQVFVSFLTKYTSSNPGVAKGITEVLLESSVTLIAEVSFYFLNFNTFCNMSNIISIVETENWSTKE